MPQRQPRRDGPNRVAPSMVIHDRRSHIGQVLISLPGYLRAPAQCLDRAPLDSSRRGRRNESYRDEGLVHSGAGGQTNAIARIGRGGEALLAESGAPRGAGSHASLLRIGNRRPSGTGSATHLPGGRMPARRAASEPDLASELRLPLKP